MAASIEVKPKKRRSSSSLDKLIKFTWIVGGPLHVGPEPERLQALLRHPYENWAAEFSHHSHTYSRHHTALANQLVSQIVAMGKTSYLGDRDWVSAVVHELLQLPPSRGRARKAAVNNILEAVNMGRSLPG
jgi:hypothetical protein